MTFDSVKFVEAHGVVLASAKGPVPCLAEAVAGGAIRGSWWGHPRGKEIFKALSALGESPDVRCFKLVQGKVTFVHRRLLPALVRLVDVFGKERLTAIRQEHTESGAHRNVKTPFEKWVTPELKAAARMLSVEQAQAELGAWSLAAKRTVE